VLLYGFETWLVTTELRRKSQTFSNRCLRFILRIWWPITISNRELWQLSGQTYINMEIRKRKFRWIGHTLRMMSSHQRSRFSGILKETEEGGDQETAGGDPL
jgi:hypothetical protein